MAEELNGSGGEVNQDQLDLRDSTTFDTISELNNQRIGCEDNGDFMEASRIKEKIHRLGEEFYRRKLIELKNKHQNEKDQLENEFQRELNQCNDFWNNKIESYNEQSGSLEMELRQKHEQKLEGYQELLDEKVRQVGKPSPEVLNLEYQIKRLVKDQRYKEAHALQKKCEELKNKCMQKIESATNNRKQHKIEHFIQQQENEMQALCYKIDTGREELIKSREKDYQKLVAKYRVLRENLDDSQILEFQKTEKTLKNFKPSSNLFNKSFAGESKQG